MDEYFVPAGAGEADFTEKRSEFLGHVRVIESEEEARSFIAETKKKYHDARHNCWCYAVTDGAVRYSDDGEPQGSAGLPMLEVFRREKVTNFVCVVTRYFGGILLGTGGLLRAYTRSAADALSAAGIAAVRRRACVEVECSYSLLERMKDSVARFDGEVDSVEYTAQVTLRAHVPEENTEDFCRSVTDISSGTAAVKTVGTQLVPVKIR